MQTKIFLFSKEYSLIKISGQECKNFLHGQFSCNIKTLKKKQPIYCSYIDISGRITAFFIIFLYKENEYIIFLKTEVVKFFIKDLKKYIMFLKIKIEDISETWSSMVLFNIEENKIIDNTNLIKFYYNKNLFLFGYEKYIKIYKKELPNFISINYINIKHYKYINICNGLFVIHKETINKFLPNNVNLIKFIDFSKGCFRGQEIVIRMKHLGSIKKRLAILKKKDKEIFNIASEVVMQEETNKSVGNVITYTYYKKNIYILALLKLNLDKSITYSIKDLNNFYLIKYV